MNLPATRRVGDEFYYEWPDTTLGITLSRIRDKAGDLSGEIHVQSVNGTTEHVHRARLSLLSTQSRQGLVRFLQTRGTQEIDWQDVIEQACEITIRKWREGVPLLDLADAPDPQPGRDLIAGYIPMGETSVAFGDGGSLKSTIAAGVVGLSVATGHAIVPGLMPQLTAPVLYLDWESNETEHVARLRSLCRVAGITLPRGMFHYQTQFKPLVDQERWLRETVAERGIGVVIVDSLVPAVGGEPKDAQPIAALFNTLRSLGHGVTSHILAHMSKGEAGRENGRARAYGSVFVENLARYVVEVRLSEDAPDENVATVGLYCRKANVAGPRSRKPFALQVAFNDQHAPATIRKAEIRDVGDLASRLPLRQRVRETLARGAMTTGELSAALDVSEATIRVTCSRMDDVGNTTFTAGGRGKEATWGLLAHE